MKFARKTQHSHLMFAADEKTICVFESKTITEKGPKKE